MKYCLLLLSVLVFGGCGGKSESIGTESVSPYYREFGLASSAKRAMVKTYEATSRFGDIVKGDITGDCYLVEFDVVASIATCTNFDSEGYVSEIQRFTYDDNNFVELLVLDNNGEPGYCQVLNYDGDICTSIITTNYWVSDDTPRVEICEYNRDGELATGYVVKSEDGTVLSRGVYNYPEKSVEEIVTYSASGEELGREIRHFNDAGRITKMIKNDKHCEIEYNDRNLPIRFVNVEPYRNTLFAISSEDEEMLYFAEYKYDARGNWTTQIIYKGDIKLPYRISEREITY